MAFELSFWRDDADYQAAIFSVSAIRGLDI